MSNQDMNKNSTSGSRGNRPVGRNEGEGNRTAAREYNKDTQNFVKSGQVDEKAREARDAIAGAEGERLRQAEEAGKSRSRGEDPTAKH